MRARRLYESEGFIVEGILRSVWRVSGVRFSGRDVMLASEYDAQAAAGAVTGREARSAEARNRLLIERFYHDMWNHFDKSLIPELLAKDFIFRGSLGQEKRGLAEFADYMDFIRGAFPDFHNEIEEVVSEGDRSFARLAYRATHRGEVFGIPGTGKSVRYAGAALFRFQGDQIRVVWVLGVVFGLVLQLSGCPRGA
jgi:steroid delta-isomerase-like uncharacterized protein